LLAPQRGLIAIAKNTGVPEAELALRSLSGRRQSFTTDQRQPTRADKASLRHTSNVDYLPGKAGGTLFVLETRNGTSVLGIHLAVSGSRGRQFG
jgi:hypothetical protein